MTMERVRKQRWGYKGTETALNGLTGWMYEHVEMKGTTSAKYRIYCQIIVQYGVANISGFKKKGQPEYQADYIAKKIDANKMFHHFTNWVKNDYTQSL